MEHHPKYFFVRGWNERKCDCKLCQPVMPLGYGYAPPAQHAPSPEWLPAGLGTWTKYGNAGATNLG